MKTKLFSLFLALMASVGTMTAEIIERVQIGELYYNLDTENKTAEVTSQNSSSPYWSTSITVAHIPSSVNYDEVTYSVTSIRKNAFDECTGLTSVTIPSSVISIGYKAFYKCTSLTSIIIPNSITSIEDWAFLKCTSLTSIDVSTNNPNYCSIDGALFNKAQTTLIQYPACKQGACTIPNRVTAIGPYAFYGCTSITSITIPNSVTSIGVEAFWGCSAMSSMTIPNSVTSIGDFAFNSCTGLTSVTIPNSLTYIGKDAFYRCTGLTLVTWNAKNCNSCKFGNQVESFVFGDEVEVIPDGICLSLNKLTSIVIPSSVISIGAQAFSGCSSLLSVTIPNSVARIRNEAFLGCSGLASVTIPNSVTSIGNEAFRDCTGLTSLTIPNSVTSFGSYVFSGCSSLTSVSIPNSVTSIANGAFWGCAGLTSIIIPNNVKFIGESAFSSCSSLTSIACEAVTPPTLMSNIFTNVEKTIPLYVLAGSVDAYKAADQWKDFTNILPIAAQETDVTTPVVEPDVTSAEIAWPAISNAYTYELVIKDASGKVICTITFNAQGQLTNIAFNAPARNNESQQTQSAGFAFTVTGLEPGTQYSYSIIAKNASGTTLSTETGTFVTKALEGLDQISQEPSTKSQKQIKDGQILILKGDKTYTLTGQKVK